MADSKLRRLLFVLFFLSGLAALVYEVVWARKLSLIFGTTTYAVSSILAVFFAGLALGSWFFGKWVDRGREPLKTYAFLELGIGVYAALTPWIFRLIEGLQIAFWQKFSASGGPTYSGFSIFTFGLSFLGLIIPTTLMGGTLPVISKAFSVQRLAFRVGRDVGFLYFVNTAGAVLGAFLAGFLLIAYLGVNQTIWLAALINLLIGITILGVSRIQANKELIKANERIKSRMETNAVAFGSLKRMLTNERMPILLAFGAAGFAALALEVLWTRVLVITIGGSIYAFTLVLVSFLVGIALGSAIMSRFTDRLRNSLIWFAGIEILLGILVILLTPLLGDLPFWFLGIYQSFGESFGSLQFGLWLLAFAVMILPTLLMGVAFPIVVKATSLRSADETRISADGQVGERVGMVYAANTVGGIFGALAAGFVFIPLIGVQKGILVAGSIYLLIGTALIFYAIRTFAQIRFKFAYISVLVLALLTALLGLRLPSWEKSVLSAGFYKEPFAYLGKEKKEIRRAILANKILFYKEGLSATISVTQDIYEGNLSLRINGKTDASTGADMENQVLAGHLPMFFHPDPKDVLVIGLGSGVTLGSVEQYPVKTIDMVEIEPVVVEAAKFFAKYNYNALEDERVNLVIADGRNFLLAMDKKYDIISSEPSNLWLTGVSNLFTKEFYELAKNHLREDGVMVQWVHLYAMGEEDLKTALRTFDEVFPHTLAFNVLTSDDMLLVGAKKELKIDLAMIGEKIAQEKVRKDIERIGFRSSSGLFSYFSLDEKALESLSQQASVHTDNHPILEFSAPKSLYLPTQARNLREIMKFWIGPSAFISGTFDKAKLEELIEFREHFAKMMIAFTEDNLGEGAKQGEEAFKINSGHPGVLEYLSQIYLYQGTFALERQDYQAAEAAFLRALAIRKTTKGHFRLGSFYLNQGRFSEAEKELSAAVARAPEFAAAHLNLGLALEHVGDLNRAIEEFEKTLEFDPEYLKAHEELVKLYEMRGDFGRAEEHRKLIRE